MAKQFIVSDLHFGHKNIIEYCDRPTTIECMDEWLINQLNKYIDENDDVYHVGDFTLKNKNIDYMLSILKRLNGKWKFILGNHDHEESINKLCNLLPEKAINLGWYHVVKLSGRKFVLHHFPHRSWQDSRHGSINAHGHCHGSLKGTELPNQIDVGIDAVENFIPLTSEQIIEIVNSKNLDGKFVNHHEGQKTGNE
jgi:calcineurin-like phosphoesterase family protein